VKNDPLYSSQLNTISLTFASAVFFGLGNSKRLLVGTIGGFGTGVAMTLLSPFWETFKTDKRGKIRREYQLEKNRERDDEEVKFEEISD